MTSPSRDGCGAFIRAPRGAPRRPHAEHRPRAGEPPPGNKAHRSILLQNEKAPGDLTKKRAFYFWICCLTEKHVSVTHNK